MCYHAAAVAKNHGQQSTCKVVCSGVTVFLGWWVGEAWPQPCFPTPNFVLFDGNYSSTQIIGRTCSDLYAMHSHANLLFAHHTHTHTHTHTHHTHSWHSVALLCTTSHTISKAMLVQAPTYRWCGTQPLWGGSAGHPVLEGAGSPQCRQWPWPAAPAAPPGRRRGLGEGPLEEEEQSALA